MNRNDRRKVKAAAHRYCSINAGALREFSEIVEEMKANEEEKLDNIPENLQDSSQALNIEESIEMLEEVQENLDTIDEAYNAIADSIGTEIIVKTIPIEKTDDTSPRNNRFQILLTEELLSKLREESLRTGFSCNEVVCRALKNEFERIQA